MATDMHEAAAALERLTAVLTDPGFVLNEIALLRLRAPLASLGNGVASAAALLLRRKVLHHLAKVDNNGAQLVNGGVPIFHTRPPVRKLLRQFIVVCVGVDLLLDLAAHIREGQLSWRPDVGEPVISHVRASLLQKNKVPESRTLSVRCREVSPGSLSTD
jgi:hypothetical protein